MSSPNFIRLAHYSCSATAGKPKLTQLPSSLVGVLDVNHIINATHHPVTILIAPHHHRQSRHTVGDVPVGAAEAIWIAVDCPHHPRPRVSNRQIATIVIRDCCLLNRQRPLEFQERVELQNRVSWEWHQVACNHNSAGSVCHQVSTIDSDHPNHVMIPHPSLVNRLTTVPAIAAKTSCGQVFTHLINARIAVERCRRR